MKNKRPTKLEEALLKVHLDIDGDREETLDAALHQIRQLIQLIIGQDEIEDHDVNLTVQVVIQERNKLRGEQRESAEKLVGREVGVGQRV